MTTEQATLIVSLLIIFAQGLGALINNSRYSSLKDKMQEEFSKLRERIRALEVKVTRNGAGDSQGV
jgi:hypothetical protein